MTGPADQNGPAGREAPITPRERRRGRRVRTSGVPGSDPSPQNEPPRFAETDNDDRLAADKPPHWG